MRRLRVLDAADPDVDTPGWTPIRLGPTPPNDPAREAAERVITEVVASIDLDQPDLTAELRFGLAGLVRFLFLTPKPICDLGWV